jgi:hypothetical protein
MAKPIAVLYMQDGAFGQQSCGDIMRSLNNNYGEKNNGPYNTNGFWTDYYWFVFPTNANEMEPMRLEVFREKYFTEIQFNELKDLVLQKLNSDYKIVQ